ncbi:MAG: efflux RND transporter periplasmic adaptor subunit, partial [Kofleriaceae bacterium]
MIGRVIIAALAVASCGGESAPDRQHAGDHRAPDDDHGAAHAGDHGDPLASSSPKQAIVRIAPEMIRDLRVTTTRAETRTAGERVSVLAELRVDQDAYAEVASPAAARVVRVLAKAGDPVKANQPLVELTSADLSKARAELRAADARLALARKTLERKQALLAERLIPEREVIDARAAVAEAEAARTIAGGATQQFAGATGGVGLVLRAPVEGTVIDRDVVVGQLADPS